MSSATATRRFGGRTTADEVVAGLDLGDRTMIVTGANTGIGYDTARALAAAGARVILACRNPETGAAAAQRIRTAHPGARAEFAPLDLASLASVRAFCDALDAPVIDTLICNAGLASLRWDTTEDGFERTVGVCHIGHFLLTQLLLPRLLAASAPRVVMVSSESHRSPRRLNFDRLPLNEDNFSGLVAYGQAKLCNLLMAKALQRRYGDQGLTACALHPGTLVSTDIGRNSGAVALLMKLVSPFTKSCNQGAATTVFAAVHEPASEIAGCYLSDCRVATSTAESDDPDVAARLWALSEQWVGASGPGQSAESAAR